MANRKNIISCFLLSLVVFFSNSQVGSSFIPPRLSDLNIHNYLSAGGNAGSGVSVNYPSIKKDWIKVRYMGGEYHFGATFPSFTIATTAFVNHITEAGYTSFVSSSHPFLFKLRGPPSMY